MRRFAAAISFVFVASLMLAAYGHCWPMLVVQIDSATASHAHAHDVPDKPHNHPKDGFGQELSVPGVPPSAVAVIAAPIAKSFAPVLLVASITETSDSYIDARPSPRARAGPPSFSEFHARTGRLLI
jgi:hypothetical protein